MEDTQAPTELAAFVQWLQDCSSARTREEFAYAAGVRPEQLSRWATGRGMTARNLLRLIRAAGVFPEAPIPAMERAGDVALAELQDQRGALEHLQASVQNVADTLDTVLLAIRQLVEGQQEQARVGR